MSTSSGATPLLGNLYPAPKVPDSNFVFKPQTTRNSGKRQASIEYRQPIKHDTPATVP